MKEFRYNNITQPNRNRLLWIDPTVDGVKTGHTEAAGYCLISSAMRDKRRLLSVVLGTKSDAARASESLKAAQLGLSSPTTPSPLYAKDQAVATLRVWKGLQKEVKAGFTADLVDCRTQRLCRQSQERLRRRTAPDRTDRGRPEARHAEGQHRRQALWRISRHRP
jgi:D-alanyl-D-alanine carboxypeptidase